MRLPDKEEMHRLSRIEKKYRLLYFLRDMGIDSAGSAATETWLIYVEILAAVLNDYEDFHGIE